MNKFLVLTPEPFMSLIITQPTGRRHSIKSTILKKPHNFLPLIAKDHLPYPHRPHPSVTSTTTPAKPRRSSSTPNDDTTSTRPSRCSSARNVLLCIPIHKRITRSNLKARLNRHATSHFPAQANDPIPSHTISLATGFLCKKFWKDAQPLTPVITVTPQGATAPNSSRPASLIYDGRNGPLVLSGEKQDKARGRLTASARERMRLMKKFL